MRRLYQAIILYGNPMLGWWQNFTGSSVVQLKVVIQMLNCLSREVKVKKGNCSTEIVTLTNYIHEINIENLYSRNIC